jgi:hypothetical protein
MKKFFFNRYFLFYGITVPYITALILVSVSCQKAPQSSSKSEDEAKVIDMSDERGSGELTYKIVKIRGVSYYASRVSTDVGARWVIGGEVKVIDDSK